MDSLVAMARNIRHSIVDDCAEPSIELVLTTMERHSRIVGSQLLSVEECETIRFIVSPDGARKLAANLEEWADQAEFEAERITVELEQK